MERHAVEIFWRQEGKDSPPLSFSHSWQLPMFCQFPSSSQSFGYDLLAPPDSLSKSTMSYIALPKIQEPAGHIWELYMLPGRLRASPILLVVLYMERVVLISCLYFKIYIACLSYARGLNWLVSCQHYGPSKTKQCCWLTVSREFP